MVLKETPLNKKEKIIKFLEKLNEKFPGIGVESQETMKEKELKEKIKILEVQKILANIKVREIQKELNLAKDERQFQEQVHTKCMESYSQMEKEKKREMMKEMEQLKEQVKELEKKVFIKKRVIENQADLIEKLRGSKEKKQMNGQAHLSFCQNALGANQMAQNQPLPIFDAFQVNQNQIEAGRGNNNDSCECVLSLSFDSSAGKPSIEQKGLGEKNKRERDKMEQRKALGSEISEMLDENSSLYGWIQEILYQNVSMKQKKEFKGDENTMMVLSKLKNMKK